jgi:hypothetical protein
MVVKTTFPGPALHPQERTIWYLLPSTVLDLDRGSLKRFRLVTLNFSPF